jgi:hypothetical protein
MNAWNAGQEESSGARMAGVDGARRRSLSANNDGARTAQLHAAATGGRRQAEEQRGGETRQATRRATR